MARLLGDRIMPESIQSRRRSLRNRLDNLRDPVRSRREDMVPGPDLIGTAENRLSDLRDSIVSRDSATASFREMLGMDSDDSGSVVNGNGESDTADDVVREEGSRGRTGEEVRA